MLTTVKEEPGSHTVLNMDSFDTDNLFAVDLLLKPTMQKPKTMCDGIRHLHLSCL